MPIRPDRKSRYPDDWPQITARIRERAGDRCECDGRCGARQHQAGRCGARHGQRSPYNTSTVVVLAIMHLNHDEADCRDENLMAGCQLCHLAYDRPHHAETRARTAAAARAVRERNERLIAAGQLPGQETLF